MQGVPLISKGSTPLRMRGLCHAEVFRVDYISHRYDLGSLQCDYRNLIIDMISLRSDTKTQQTDSFWGHDPKDGGSNHLKITSKDLRITLSQLAMVLNYDAITLKDFNDPFVNTVSLSA
ncbi:hypothetical protein [Aquimarina pacifica]|uniref:hypothetical protein n=1 Tax=Aquimarina pacifica TaxID=1296415 RepID=UPI00046E77F4|nr:hypothetical protein [Aquimarina pacifica]